MEFLNTISLTRIFGLPMPFRCRLGILRLVTPGELRFTQFVVRQCFILLLLALGLIPAGEVANDGVDGAWTESEGEDPVSLPLSISEDSFKEVAEGSSRRYRPLVTDGHASVSTSGPILRVSTVSRLLGNLGSSRIHIRYQFRATEL